ncbi:hypothetical protein BKA63DRAFT_601836 [Paraphoma chrysanthemicola]|nr:hypothetical protein BKA63DRAFT_601836 [Paraphoma chrysanthemicola]
MISFAQTDGKSWNDPSLFDKIDEYLYVTVSRMDSGIKYGVEPKRNDDLVPLIESSSASPVNREWSLQLLIAPQVYERNVKRLPYSKQVIEAIQSNWRIADVCFRAHLKAGSCAMLFNPKPCDPSWKGFMIRFMYSLPFKCTLAVSYDRSTRSTYGICFGIESTNINALLSKLHFAQEHAHQPFLVPLLMTDMALAGLQDFSSKTYHDFLPVREAMGCNLYFNPESRYTAPDLSDMPRKLTALANAGASNSASLSATKAVINHLDRQLEEEQLRKDGDLIVRMRDYLTLMREVVDGTKRRNDYLKESVQAQVQMVYALLAQQDNALNHRYGADMRVIATVTLLFLPGTFVATLFSASFWDFSPGNQSSKVSSWSFTYSWPWFLRLPSELQLHVLGLCDDATLFQLMHVSSAIRTEARKLFWSKPNKWYEVGGMWLLAGAFAGHTYAALDHDLGCVQSLYVDFNTWEPLEDAGREDGMATFSEPYPIATPTFKVQRIRNSWQTLQRRFPSVKRVALSEGVPQRPGGTLPDDFRLLADGSPTSIATYVSFLTLDASHSKRCRRQVWQPTRKEGAKELEWNSIDQAWTPKVIFLPVRTFHGPAGRYYRARYKNDRHGQRIQANRLIFVHATEAYYTQHPDLPQPCPVAGCNAQFSKPGQWAVHSAEMGYDGGQESHPDTDFQRTFSQRGILMEREYNRMFNELLSMQEDWGKEGSKQRQDAEEAFVHQLERDPMYTHQKPPRECRIWRLHQAFLSLGFTI